MRTIMYIRSVKKTFLATELRNDGRFLKYGIRQFARRRSDDKLTELLTDILRGGDDASSTTMAARILLGAIRDTSNRSVPHWLKVLLGLTVACGVLTLGFGS